MKTSQVPLRSPFGPQSTASEVLDGIDLTGKTVIVTGGHSGLGLESTRALANVGAQVTVAARDPDAAKAALAGIQNVSVDQLDLADIDSVRRFAERFLDSGLHLDILIGSAGVMACPESRVGPGWEAQFAVNHLGHFALVNLLRPALKGGSRVISVSSAGHQHSGIRWDDVQFEKRYDKWLAYGQSKTANSLFAVQLDRLGKSAGIRAFSLHPGKIFTPLQRHLSQGEMVAAGWMDSSGRPSDPTFKTPQQGAATQVWAATSALLDGRGGVYCEDCNIAHIDQMHVPSYTGVRAHAIDPDEAERLWALSATLTSMDAFAARGQS